MTALGGVGTLSWRCLVELFSLFRASPRVAEGLHRGNCGLLHSPSPVGLDGSRASDLR